jgi:hypothetical protein
MSVGVAIVSINVGIISVDSKDILIESSVCADTIERGEKKSQTSWKIVKSETPSGRICMGPL